MSTDEILEIYLEFPMDDGEAVLLLPDEAVCLELGHLPAQAGMLADLIGDSTTALLAVARSGRRPRPADLLAWTELSAELEGSPTALLPLRVLPAA